MTETARSGFLLRLLRQAVTKHKRKSLQLTRNSAEKCFEIMAYVNPNAAAIAVYRSLVM